MHTPRPVDVCLVLEGTYPYMSGGVSTWVHQIVTAMPDLRFAIFYIGAEQGEGLRPKYDLPKNIVSIDTVFLFDGLEQQELVPRKPPKAVKRALYKAMAEVLAAPSGAAMPHQAIKLAELISRTEPSFSCANLWEDREAWELVCAAYGRHMPGESFLKFYWNARFLVQPLWQLIRSSDRIPQARLYHSLCTGYAGFAAALAARRNNAPYLLSEHGIYVKERLAEIQNAPWIHDTPLLRPRLFEKLEPFKTLWFSFFKALAGISYACADRITSLFENNAEMQRQFGAAADKIKLIPNGIRLSDFDAVCEIRAQRLHAAPSQKNVGFLGRIVKIKDIKTLLRAARLVLDRFPETQFLLAGETTDDPDYFRECTELAAHLGITGNMRFMGPLDRADLLGQSDVMVLTSISEGLPFVIIEAFAAQVPLVATDTGACRELIAGGPAENPRLGPAGLLTPIGDPAGTAAGLIALLDNTLMRQAFGMNGRRRAEAFYRIEQVIARYRELYTGLAPQSAPARAATG